MFAPVLSVLLMGMLPMWGGVSEQAVIGRVTVASPSPVAAAPAVNLLGRGVSASGVLIVDLQSGQSLFERRADVRRPMGSLTKLMTALLIVEHHGLDEIVTVPDAVRTVDGNKAGLRPGERFTVDDLLSALLLHSANDAALTLAHFHSGSASAFVSDMNDRAEALGLSDTSFANPAGFDHPNQWSTPRDIAWLGSFVLRRPVLRERMSAQRASITSLAGRSIALTHTHELLNGESPVVAGKTGTTAGARQCLLSVVREGDREYIIVLLGSRDRYADMRAMLRVFTSLFV